MFGFSRRRKKLGRLKGHLNDHFHGSRSPFRSNKRHNHPLIMQEGEGSKMIVFGGDSGTRLLDDTKILSLDKLTWDSVAPKVRSSPTGRSSKLPPCKGHCLSGLLHAYIIKKLYIGRHSTEREVALMMLMAYLSYMLAEAFLVDLDYHVLPGLPVRPTWPNTFTLRFNTSGNLLIGAGGSVCTPGVGYVLNIHLWNPLSRTHQTFYNSGHDNVVRAVEFLTDTMIASGSMDCTVRLGLLHEDGRADTQSIGTHGATVSALAVQYPNNNVLYSGGEDGRIIMNDIRQKSCTNLLACRQYSTHQRLEIVSLVFDSLMPYQAAVAGDGKFVRMYDVRGIDQCVDHFCPPHIALAPYKRRISGIAFSHSSELLVSYEWEKMYLFGKKMGLGHNPELLTDNFLEELDSPTLYTGHYNSNQNMGVTFFGLDDTLVGTGSQRWLVLVLNAASSAFGERRVASF